MLRFDSLKLLAAALVIAAIGNGDAHAKNAIVTAIESDAIVSPSNPRETRVLLYFELPEEILRPEVIIDFAVLSLSVGIKDAVMGQIEVLPLMTAWTELDNVGWFVPWSQPGGDCTSDGYAASSYVLREAQGIVAIPIDITGIVRSWLEGEFGNNGLLIKISESDILADGARLRMRRDDVSVMIRYTNE
jgi:hypothetical protein